MVNTKISDLTALTGADVANDDPLAIVDASATQTKKITADEMRKYMQGRRGARISRVTNQTIAASTEVATIFTAENYDTDGCADLGAQSTRLTVPTGVTLIRLHGFVKYTATVSNMYLYTFKNGAAFITPSGGGFEMAAVTIRALSASSSILSVVAGDYFELYNFSGGGTLAGAWFEMEILG